MEIIIVFAIIALAYLVYVVIVSQRRTFINNLSIGQKVRFRSGKKWHTGTILAIHPETIYLLDETTGKQTIRDKDYIHPLK